MECFIKNTSNLTKSELATGWCQGRELGRGFSCQLKWRAEHSRYAWAPPAACSTKPGEHSCSIWHIRSEGKASGAAEEGRAPSSFCRAPRVVAPTHVEAFLIRLGLCSPWSRGSLSGEAGSQYLSTEATQHQFAAWNSYSRWSRGASRSFLLPFQLTSMSPAHPRWERTLQRGADPVTFSQAIVLKCSLLSYNVKFSSATVTTPNRQNAIRLSTLDSHPV